MVLFKIQLSFILLLSFSLWSKQESHSQHLWKHSNWLKPLLLVTDISLSKMCIKNSVCVHFLVFSFMHSVSLMLLLVP